MFEIKLSLFSISFIMIQAFIISAILLLAGILLLGVRVFFTKNGSFPNIHIGGSKAMKDRGISCATSQDRDARRKPAKPAAITMVDDMLQNF